MLFVLPNKNVKAVKKDFYRHTVPELQAILRNFSEIMFTGGDQVA